MSRLLETNHRLAYEIVKAHTIDREYKDLGGINYFSRLTAQELITVSNLRDDLRGGLFQNGFTNLDQMLRMIEQYPEVTFHGFYGVGDREDDLSIEGYDIVLPAEIGMYFMSSWGQSDDTDVTKLDDGNFLIHTWWD